VLVHKQGLQELTRDFKICIESYYKFDSNNVNPNCTHKVNKNSTYCTL